MPKQYIVHWSPVVLKPLEILKCVEPILATYDFKFSGEARRLEIGFGGALYYQLETVEHKGKSASDILSLALAKGWHGVALELFYNSYYVSLSFFSENEKCSMILDEESTLFYEQNEDDEASQNWVDFLMQLTTSIKASLCLFEKEPVKRVIDPTVVAKSIIREGFKLFRNPIVAIIHDSLISLENVMMLNFGDIKTKITTNGYSVFTWMGKN